MRYKDYEGPVEELVRMKMKEIEEKEQICVLQLIKKYRRQNKARLYFYAAKRPKCLTPG